MDQAIENFSIQTCRVLDLLALDTCSTAHGRYLAGICSLGIILFGFIFLISRLLGRNQ